MVKYPPLPDGPWIVPVRPRRDGRDLLSSTQVPCHQQVPYILCGYRPCPKGACGLFRTVFALHNETGNMWTHLVGFAYFLVVGIQLVLELSKANDDISLTGESITAGNHTAARGHGAITPDSMLSIASYQEERIWVLVLVCASAFCLLCSFSYHLCSCAGRCIHECTYKLDLTGIVVLIMFSYFTGIALGYRCYPALRRFYLFLSAGISVALAAPLLRPKLVRDLTSHFIVCVSIGVIPAMHWLSISSRDDIATVVPYLLAMFGCYGGGAWFYIQRWPERQWPGRFDLVGHSHQLWHIFVLLAAASWVHCMRVLLRSFSVLKCDAAADAAVVPITASVGVEPAFFAAS